MPGKTYYYKNINVELGGVTLPILVWGIWGGVLFAIVVALIVRSFTGDLVHRLKNARSVDAGSAKTLDDLDFRGLKRIFAWLFLHDSSSLLRYVKIANADEAAYLMENNGKNWKLKKVLTGRSFKLSSARFYLPEEHRITAETRFSEEKHPVRSFVIATVILTAGAVFAAYALPELLQMLDNFITMSAG